MAHGGGPTVANLGGGIRVAHCRCRPTCGGGSKVVDLDWWTEIFDLTTEIIF